MSRWGRCAGPFINVYYSSQFAPLIIFFLLYLSVVKNNKLHHFVRYNCMQVSSGSEERKRSVKRGYCCGYQPEGHMNTYRTHEHRTHGHIQDTCRSCCGGGGGGGKFHVACKCKGLEWLATGNIVEPMEACMAFEKVLCRATSPTL